MSVRLRDLLMNELGALRYEPTDKRIRASLDGRIVIDTTRARLVWEPMRIVPTYAVPVEDLGGGLSAVVAEDGADPVGVPAIGAPRLADRVVLDPSVPFSAHTTDGERLTIRAVGSDRSLEAFRPTDPAMADYILVDFGAFDAWYEEDERNVAHPRDPFHRIDILHSSRHVRVELDGKPLADSPDPYLLFESSLPVRYYLPIDDVRLEELEPSEHETYCAYKGRASYWSTADEENVAWTYRQPLREAAEIAGRIAFFNERVDLFVDDEPLSRPITPWSPRS